MQPQTPYTSATHSYHKRCSTTVLSASKWPGQLYNWPLRFGTGLAAAFCWVGRPAAWGPWSWPGWPWATSTGWAWHGHRLFVAHAASGGVIRGARAVHNVRLGPRPLPSMTLKWTTSGKKQKTQIHKSCPWKQYLCKQSQWRVKKAKQKGDLWQLWQRYIIKMKMRRLTNLEYCDTSRISVFQWLTQFLMLWRSTGKTP